MNTQSATLVVSSAYSQLKAAERSFVDQYITEIEKRANRAGQPLRLYGKIIPEDMRRNSHGMIDLPIVIAALSERIMTIVDQSELTSGRILKELQCIAFASFDDALTLTEMPDGTFQKVLDLTKPNPDQMRAFAEVDVKELPMGGRQAKAKYHCKLKALGMLMKYTGMLEADNKYWHEQEMIRANIEREVIAIEKGSTPEVVQDRYRNYIKKSG